MTVKKDQRMLHLFNSFIRLVLETWACFNCCLDGAVLIHTTQGDLLRSLSVDVPGFPSTSDDVMKKEIQEEPVNLLLMSRECFVLALYGRRRLVLYTTNGRVCCQSEAISDIEVRSDTDQTDTDRSFIFWLLYRVLSVSR